MLFKKTSSAALILSGLLALTACPSGGKKKEKNETPPVALRPLAYDLTRPTARFELPKSLREVSGLTYYQGTQLACVQDEKGDIFPFDYQSGEVGKRLQFGPDGDYEGLEFVDGKFYVLRSDGVIFIVRPGEDTFEAGGTLSNGSRSLQTIDLGLAAGTDVEGLGYDPKTKRLLIALKESPGEPDKHFVYFYDFGKKIAWKGIALTPEKLAQEAGLSGKAAKFKPSGVAVHPKTGDVYLLAADGKKLLMLDRMGIIRSVASLDSDQFRQPEGICFAPDGTLFIASEGKGDPGYILKFSEQTAQP